MSAIRTGFTPRLRIRPRTSSDRMGGARRATRTGRAPATSRRRRSYTDIDLPWAHPYSVAPACSGGKRAPRGAHVTFGPAAAFARRYVGLACAHAKLRAPCAVHARCTHPAGSSQRALGSASRRVARACGTGVLARSDRRLHSGFLRACDNEAPGVPHDALLLCAWPSPIRRLAAACASEMRASTKFDRFLPSQPKVSLPGPNRGEFAARS